jgi:hypothetical protein
MHIFRRGGWYFRAVHPHGICQGDDVLPFGGDDVVVRGVQANVHVKTAEYKRIVKNNSKMVKVSMVLGRTFKHHASTRSIEDITQSATDYLQHSTQMGSAADPPGVVANRRASQARCIVP